jgi:hypothetical protein
MIKTGKQKKRDIRNRCCGSFPRSKDRQIVKLINQSKQNSKRERPSLISMTPTQHPIAEQRYNFRTGKLTNRLCLETLKSCPIFR